MKRVSSVLACLMVVMASTSASAANYIYVGSWSVSDGPYWETNPPVYSGQDAAAMLFGGLASDYAISTVDNNPDHINFRTWLDGWADESTYGPLGGVGAPQDYKLDTGGSGYNSNYGVLGSAYSAYVRDHDMHAVNYAFKVAPVPEPETYAMMLTGLGVLGFAGKRRRRG